MKLLIVDDHELMREGLSSFLRQCAPDVVVMQARDGEDACAAVVAHADLDAVILDLTMPGMDGLVVAAMIADKRHDLPVMFLSASEEPADVRRALAAGARGYVPKSATRQTLWSALQLVLSGNVYVPPLMLAREDATAVTRHDKTWSSALARLTERQVDVLRLIADGASNKEIARLLNLAEKTIKVHVGSIFKTLGVVNRRQAAEAARHLNGQG